MNKKITNIKFENRYLGIIVLVTIYFIVGLIHIFFGLIMLIGNLLVANFSIIPIIYSIYTFLYGFLTLIFAYLFWTGKRSGWSGIILISLFVILVDTLTFLNFLTILGIPKIAAIGEIPFSILIVVYHLQNHIRSNYNI
ncbi:MAG: hypothetical protein P8X91_00810 [Candidatus Bathyarchaeota archaeon]